MKKILLSLLFFSFQLSIFNILQAQASCDTIRHAAMPYLIDFEGQTDSSLFVNGCWQRGAIATVPYVSTNSFADIHCDSMGCSLRLAVDHHRMPVTVALPPLDDLSDLAITFKFYKEGANYVWNGTNLENNLLGSIKVGVLEDSNDLGSFVTLAHLSTNETWTRYTVRLARYHGQGKVIAFRGYKMYPNSDSDTDFVYMHIDSIDIHPATGCGGVDWVDNSQVTNTKATIRWNDPERVGNFRVSLMGDGVDTTIVTTDTVVNFTGLTPGTDYTGRLHGLCSSGDSSTIIFYVSTYGGLIPDSITVSDITPHSAKVSWVPQGEETRWYAYVTDSNGISPTGLTECDTAELQLTNLEGNMRYTVKISPDLGVWGQMLWSDTVGFTTLDPCAPKPLPFAENFNDVFDAQEVESGYLPECWDYTWDGDLSWSYAPHMLSDGYYYPSPDGSPLLLMTAGSNEELDDTAYVFLPRVADTLNHLMLRFWYGHHRLNYGKLSVGYIMNGNYVNYMDMAPTTGRHTSIGLMPLPDAAERIAFRWVYDGANWAEATLDDIELVLADSLVCHTVNVECDSAMGEVVGSGVYEEGSWCDIYAIPAAVLEKGYHVEFDGWDDGEKTNPRKVLVTDDITLTAIFRMVMDSVVGIEEKEELELKIEIYPNPASADVTIQVSEPSLISIIDMTGRIVIPCVKCNSEVRIAGPTLHPGSYFVRITNDNGCVVRKLVVKR